MLTDSGFVRTGTKYWFPDFLDAGTAGFVENFSKDNVGVPTNLLRLIVFCCCDWTTSWILLFYALEANHGVQNVPNCPYTKQFIDESIKESGLTELFAILTDLFRGALTIDGVLAEKICNFIASGVKPVKFDLQKINIFPEGTLCSIQNQMARFSVTVTQESMFSNVTKSVMIQRNTNLCVPISVCDLFYSVLQSFTDELRIKLLKYKLSREHLIACLTMRLTPRSLHEWSQYGAIGEVDTSNQLTVAERVLNRIVNPTYFECEGWRILLMETDSTLYDDIIVQASKAEIKMKTVDMTMSTDIICPLSVCCAQKKSDGNVCFHQMIMDRKDDSNQVFILKNTLVDNQNPSHKKMVTIPFAQPFYVYDYDQAKVAAQGQNFELTHEKLTINDGPVMQKDTWYLYPIAYSIKFVSNK